MKFRKDFVTNSSSSSYVCEICGRTESGFDICLSEVDMMECVNGHTFCCDEALKSSNKEELIKMVLENEWNEHVWDSESGEYKDFTEEELSSIDEEYLFDNFWFDNFCSEDGCYEVPECVCPICQFIEYSEKDLSNYLLKTYEIPRSEVFDEVKKLNKRRKKLYDNEYITYVCKKFDLNPIEIVAKWKEQFGTYRKFSEWLRE